MDVTAYHRHGPDACGGIAFHVDHTPAAGDPISADGVTYPDGTAPTDGEIIRCGSCGSTRLTRDHELAGVDLDPTGAVWT